MSSFFALDMRAIDPMAMFLHGQMLELYWLIKHPHVPPEVDDVKKALRSATPEERKAILERARMIAEYAKVVEEAVTIMPKATAA